MDAGQEKTGPEEAERRIAEVLANRSDTLDLSDLGLSALPESLSQLTWLAHLDISTAFGSSSPNRIIDLGPLAGLAQLQSLNCNDTQVSDLSPLSGLASLQSLNCSGTQVSDLTPVLQCEDLGRIFASYLSETLNGLPNPQDWPSKLEEIDLSDTRIRGLPGELWDTGTLTRQAYEAHWSDLARAGPERSPRVKLVVLGNGAVGKTQLRRRLSGLPFDPVWDSTHGIETTSAMLDHPEYEKGVQLNLWDFGGQDIYHGTHALFMRSRAVFVICWNPDHETGVEASHGALAIERRPLAYWLDFVRHTAGKDVPVILVRTRGEERRAGEALEAVAASKLADFSHVKDVVFDARTDLGLPDLRQRLYWAIDTLDEQFGAVRIGAARMDVIKALEAMRESDQHYPPKQRQFRTLTGHQFERVCKTRLNPVSSAELLLKFLNAAGDVFHREGLFEDRIILDQGWALEAIYALFERGPTLDLLHQAKGRFTRTLLDQLLWARRGHSPDEQKLFVSMMEQCGITFRISERRYDAEDDSHAEYAAPALLPSAEDMAELLADKWSDELGGSLQVLSYPFLHDGFIHRLISGMGDLAGPKGDYWATGVHLFDQDTQARGRIEIDPKDRTVTLRTQKGEHARLMEKLCKLVEKIDHDFGFKPELISSEGDEAVGPHPGEAGASPLQPGIELPPRPRLAFSYARPERDGERQELIAQIEHVSALASARGWDTLFDQHHLHKGQDLVDFMAQLSDSDKVVVVLSEKYFRSIYCMRELHRAWDGRLFSNQPFTSKVIAITSGMNIDDDKLWEETGDYWYGEEERLKGSVQKFLERGSDDYLAFAKRHVLVQNFFRQTGTILSEVATVLQPKSLQEFAENADHYLPTPR